MMIRDRFGLRKADVYFNEPIASGARVDIIEYHQWAEPVAGSQHRVFHTRVLDLTRPEEELWSEVDADTRRDIRRAQNKDGFTYQNWIHGEKEAVELITRLHNEFVALKGIARLNPEDFLRMGSHGILDLSLLRNGEGEPVAWRSHVVAGNRARAMRVGSTRMAAATPALRQQIGRGSRFLLWQDVLRFRARGIPMYDHGGWHAGPADAEMDAINRFKAEFGGHVVEEFNSVCGVTPAGLIALRLVKARQAVMDGRLMRSFQQWRARLRRQQERTTAA